MNPFFTDFNILVAMICAVVGAYGAFKIANRDRKLGMVVLLAFSVRTLVSLPGLSFNAVSGFEKDAFIAEGFMWQWCHGGRPPIFFCFPGAKFYAWLGSYVYEYIGHAPSIMVWLNVVFSSLACYITAKTTQRIWGDAAAKVAGLSLAVFPYMVYQSTVILREATICFCMAVGIYLMVRTVEKWHWVTYAGGCLSLFIAAGLHDGMILFLLAWIFYMPYGLRKSGNPRMGKNLGVVGFFLAIGFMCMVMFVGSGKIAAAVTAAEVGQKVGPLDPTLTEDSHANYDYMLPKGNPLLELAAVPALALFLLITPTIWMVKSGSDVVGFCDGLIYLWALFLIIKYRRDIFENIAAKGIFIATLLTTLLLGFGTINYGTAIRHRAKLLPALAPLAAAAIVARQRKPSLVTAELAPGSA
jgi:hypothetical protein